MHKLIFTIIFTVALISNSFAGDCKAFEWPYEREQNVSDIHAILKLNSFEKNLNYLLHEMSDIEVTSLEKSLFKYLIFYSGSKDISNFLKAIKWARVSKNNEVRIIDELKFCSLYNKTILLGE
jgi:hypothetical protein